MKRPEGIQIDFCVNDRTKEQNDILAWSYEAAEILKNNGYDCFVNKYFVSKPEEYPCGIIIIGKK